jgi:hypothetical protein
MQWKESQLCDTIAGGIMNFVHIPGITNYVDVLSKPLLKNNVFHGLVKPSLFCVPKAGRASLHTLPVMIL